jgi:hypothetical protein
MHSPAEVALHLMESTPADELEQQQRCSYLLLSLLLLLLVLTCLPQALAQL